MNFRVISKRKKVRETSTVLRDYSMVEAGFNKS